MQPSNSTSCPPSTMFAWDAALVASCFCSLGLLAQASSQLALVTAPPQQLTAPLVATKLSKTAARLPSNGAPTYPQFTSLSGSGSWQYFPAATWTSGFFPASLYLMNTRKSVLCKTDSGTGQTDWLASAERWMQGLDPVANPNAGLFGVRHDVGFLSFGWFEALTLNPNNQKAKAAINSYAKFLASRFNSVVGCTMSWNPSTQDPSEFKVIIDNMMNLELLIISSKLTGNATLYKMATSHANKTMLNHLRPDASTYHVVNYNPKTGAVVWRRTHQGYADSSTWTRGQAWGIHGFATMYKYTNDLKYWVTSRRLAQYYLSRLPSSGVPPWDFDAPVAGRPSDTSSATIAASGMLMLSRFERSISNTTGADYWANAAVRLLSSTVNLAWRTEPNWDSLLSNGTVNNPANPPNRNTGIVYGDYYFIKAGNELLSQGLLNCSNGQVPTP
ncbi:d-4,5 unsaturated-glucuronyl hydrolase-like protein [Ceratobasidium sp. AG-I]|nr:d-4,5 unsaturated-glucuronyl hydrolase-like protein [Ceratobasidium sp. AG-I]